ncbi:MAG: B12-binding domain-containing radical SAM protein [Acidimicrobiales bacterium]
MAKILLAHPLFLSKSPAERELSSPYFPLGLLYLAGYVREAGHHVSVFDATFASDESWFAEALEREAPDVVGISILAPTRATALRLARMAAASGTVVVAGGPDPTASPEPYLSEAAIDIVVHHEGEQTIVRLLDLFDGGNLNADRLTVEPGVAFRRGGDIIVNEPRPPIENLDELPLPARDLIDMERYLQTWQDEHGYSSLTIATTRGCPYGCAWCRDSVHGAGFRQRSPESVAAEVESLAQSYDIERLRLVDDVDGIDRAWFARWAAATDATGTAIPFEPLSEVDRQDLPLLDVRDSL